MTKFNVNEYDRKYEGEGAFVRYAADNFGDVGKQFALLVHLGVIEPDHNVFRCNGNQVTQLAGCPCDAGYPNWPKCSEGLCITIVDGLVRQALQENDDA